jgi:hypothetical protein
MTRAAAASVVALVSALLVSACGKTELLSQVVPAPGVYHLDGQRDVAALELRADGTFTIHRDSCVSAGVLDCGSWNPQLGAGAAVVPHEGLYWPTPREFPSTVFRRITLHGEASGDLVAVAQSPWAGSFSQRWRRGRECQRCPSASVTAGACDGPLPACTPR